MSKLFKNSKAVLSVALALAVLAVSMFTGIVINTEAACTPSGSQTIYWDGTTATKWWSDTDGASAENPIIISTAAQLLCVVKAPYAQTQGKYFKIADGIKNIVLQKEEHDNGIMQLSSESEVKAYFENSANSKVRWETGYTWQEPTKFAFYGNFDGNGVTVYGLYGANGSDSLFGGVMSSATIKNIAVKNCYLSIGNYGGFVSSNVKAIDETANDQIVTYENIEISNCYMKVTADPFSANKNIGLLNGQCQSTNITIDSVLVYGNQIEYNSSDRTVLTGLASWNNAGTGIENSVILDCSITQPSGPNYSSSNQFIKNVYSSYEADSESNSKIIAITNDQAKGPAAKENMPDLDWSIWMPSVDGYPELRSAHGELELVKTSTEHYYVCADCDSKFLFGEQTAHEWNNDTCVVCGYQCHHNEEGFYVTGEYRPATCISKEATVSYCNNCDWNQTDEYGSAPSGHALEWVEEIPAGCYANGVEAEGRKGFWHCTECGGMFIEETEAEAMWSADSIGNYLVGEEIPVIDSLIIPLGNHSAVNRADGSILIKDAGAEGHYWICYSCDGKLEAVESEEVAEEGTLTKHNFSKSICIDCGWKCTEHDYKATGVVAVAGTCYVDHEEEYKCTICGDIQNVVTQPAGHKVVKIDEVPATDRLEGMKEHYECSVCHEIYVDAEGKTKATTAELIIAKTLPAGYENVQIGNLNTDNSGKSPATGDNVASVLAVAALAGAVLVFARKK